MIVTVTPNPSLDRALEVETLVRGEVQRAVATRVDAGGKGVNVARALVANGHDAKAVLPVGGMEGDQLVALLDALGIEIVAVPIAQPVRTNVTLVEPDGTTTKLNAVGPELSAGEVDGLLAAAVEAAAGATWAAASGSLPPGAPLELFARMTEAIRAAGVQVAMDTSGRALETALIAAPDLVKPNREELAEVTGAHIETIGDVVAAAGKLRSGGVGTVVVSLGPDGAVLVDEEETVHAESSPVTPRSTVGAGDALLAGFLAAGGRGAGALAEGVAWGTAACRLPGTAMPGPSDIDRDAVAVHPPDPGRILRRPSRRASTT
jgi:1-phosphofructokinase